MPTINMINLFAVVRLAQLFHKFGKFYYNVRAFDGTCHVYFHVSMFLRSDPRLHP